MPVQAAAPGTDWARQLAVLRDWTARWLTRVFAWIDRRLDSKAVWIAAICSVLSMQAALTLSHQPWLDEWQALQIAVQSPALADLDNGLRYEGHPPLWYWILRGLAGLFRDQTLALPAAALLIAIPVQATILLAAPFTRTERLMIATSQFVLFEYLTVSRSLTLGTGLMIATAALWHHRRLPWMMIALMPLCDILFGAVSLLLVLLRWRAGRMDWFLTALWVAISVFAACTIRPAPDMVPALVPKGIAHDFAVWVANLGAVALPLQMNGFRPQWNCPAPPGLGGIALAGFLAMAWIELRARCDHAWVFSAFLAVTLVMSVTFYPLSIRHLDIAAVLLIVLVWIGAKQEAGGAARSIWWRAWLLTASLCGLGTAVIATVEPFDTAPAAAAMIDRMGLGDETWVPFPNNAGQAIAAMRNRTFERIDQHCTEQFMRWDTPDIHRIGGNAGLRLRLARKLDQVGQFYLLSRFARLGHGPLVRQIGVVLGGYDGQDYYFYVVGEGRTVAHAPALPCHGPTQPLRRS